jgi:exoribonuclease-2
MPTSDGLKDLAAIAHQAMLDRGLQPDFPADALRQLDGIHRSARASANDLRDLRSLLWCSIDNDHSKDLDQLTVGERLPAGSVKVLIAIADVDALVKPQTPLDLHAQVNTTSVYTAATIFPMLPEKLSTDLTSLGEGEDRLALVIEMTVAADGCVQASDVYRAVVQNKAKLAYRSVAAWLDGHDRMPDRVARVHGMDEQLRMQDRIAQMMRSVRYLHGALELESIEPEPIMSDGQVTSLRLARKNRAQDLIEDFMIAANSASARFLEARGVPALRRVVREPQHWERIRKVAEDLGDTLPASPDSKALGAFLARRRQADALRFPDLSLTIVKLMGPGQYVLELPGQPAPGHFGLAVDVYNHSTAPNRRFPDLITQRLLKATLVGASSPYTAEQLASLAAHCTAREDAAKKVERQVRKSAAAQLLSRHLGQTYDALVTGAADKGTWVRVLNPPVEGKLVRGQDGLSVGDRVRVQLVSLSVERGFIDFVRAGK